MAWKGVHITRPARVSLADGQLSVVQEDGEARVPLEDAAYVILDDPRVTVTGAVIAACMEAGVALITTDSRHTPFGPHPAIPPASPADRRRRPSARGVGPLRKRLWQTLVRAKIENQAALLAEHGHPNAAALCAMTALVASGDPGNVEARAARDYWRSLFEGFIRDDASDLRNKALNYGYAVVRACVARAIVACGLLPSIGVHHASQVNSFNLADDLFEPFRPLVDRAVAGLVEGREPGSELTKDDRRALAALPLGELDLSGEVMTLLTAAERSAESLARAFETGDAKALRLPSMVAVSGAVADAA